MARSPLPPKRVPSSLINLKNWYQTPYSLARAVRGNVISGSYGTKWMTIGRDLGSILDVPLA